MWVDRRWFDQSDHHERRDTSHRAFRGKIDEQSMRTPEPTAFETDGPPLESAIDEGRLEGFAINDSHHDHDTTRVTTPFQRSCIDVPNAVT